MALASVLGFNSNDAFNRSLQCEKTDNHIDELCPKLNVENIAQFITLPPYADVRFGLVLRLFFILMNLLFS
jgi:hypothetical protein